MITAEKSSDAMWADVEAPALDALVSAAKMNTTPQEAPSRFRLLRAGDMQTRTPAWLVRGVLESDSLGLVFGDPGTMKSFLALDISCCVATGTDWHGRKVKRAPVIYIAGEGNNGIARRLKAWEIRNGKPLADAPLYISAGPAALSDPSSVLEVMAAIDAIGKEHGAPGLVTLDTLARNFGDGDENSTRDMTAFIAAADMIRAAYGCTVLIVHHSGHGDKTRARGAMALKGALDAEFMMDRDETGVIRFTATKMKDAEYPAPMAFRPRTVELGMADDEGEPVTSAVLDATEYAPPARKGKEGRGKWQTVALERLHALRERHHNNLTESGHDPATARVSMDDWRLECLRAGMPKQRFYAARDSLIEQHKVTLDHGFVY